MDNQFELHAEIRDSSQLGSKQSRNLRRSGKVPAVMYGGTKEPLSISVDANILLQHLKHEAFYSHILTLTINGSSERVILRGLQRHPSKPEILHLDLLRTSEDQQLKVNVPIHFTGEDECVGVKQQGGIVSHLQTEVEVSCLPKDLPEFIPIDISHLNIGSALHLSDLVVPEGVEIIVLSHGEDTDNAIVSVNMPRVIEEEVVTEDEESEAEAEGEEKAKEEADSSEGSGKK